MRVLVVDDFEPVRTRLAALLRELPDTTVAEATRADLALAVCRAAPVDAVVLDLHTPGANGLAVITALKALHPVPLVLVLTSEPTEHHRRSCLAAGADWFFDKAHEFERALEVLARPTPPAPEVRHEKSDPSDGPGSRRNLG